MLKLLIADDELLVRQGMRRIIDWNELGISIAGDAETVPDAIEKILRLRPDIVLCDIRMPGGTGFDIIKAVKSAAPETEFILLSGYTDQDYMLSAIRSEVCDYLLKPANIEEIKRTVKKAMRKICKRREEDQRIWEHQNMVSENLDVLRNHFMEELLLTPLKPDKTEKYPAFYQMDFTGPQYRILLTRAPAGKEYALIQDLGFLFGKFHPAAAVLPSLDNAVALVLNLEPQADILPPGERDALRDCENISCPAILSPPCDSPDRLSELFPELKKLLRKSIWFAPGQFVFSEEETFPGCEEQTVSDLCAKIFESAKQRAESAVLIRQFDDLLAYLKTVKPDNDEFYDRMSTVFGTLQFLFALPVSHPIKGSSLEKIRESFAQLSRTTGEPEAKYGAGVVGKAVRYLEQHFDSSVSLESVAAELFISPSYLSRIIKEKTDRKFQDWLHYFRIEKAIALLRDTEETTYRVAELCGYNSYKLFSEHFKRRTGMTAGEYRDSLPKG